MGCDIHVRCEYLNGSGVWTDCDYYKRNPYYNAEEPDGEEEFLVAPLYDSRDYSLFAILADVRNYGVTEYIDEPRGKPEDCNEHIQADIDRWGVDGHSHSYLTLRELIEWRETHKKITQKGMISPEAAYKLDLEEVLPETWCQGTNLDWVWRTWKRECDLLKPLIEGMKDRLRDFKWCFTDEKIEENLDNIRIVFWFDN